MKYLNKVFLVVHALFIAVFLISGAGFAQEKAPEFELENLKGGVLKSSDLKDKVVILNFWDTWCPPCRREIPDFIKLQKQYDKEVVFIGAAIAQRGKNAVKKFAEENGMNYPVVIANNKAIKDFGGIYSIPTTFIIDKKGNIYKKYIGARPKNVFETDIKKLIEQGGV